MLITPPNETRVLPSGLLRVRPARSDPISDTTLSLIQAAASVAPGKPHVSPRPQKPL